MRARTEAQKRPPKTDLDRLNELIDWYQRYKPDAGKVIQMRFSIDYMAKHFGEPNEEGLSPYRDRLLRRVQDE